MKIRKVMNGEAQYIKEPSEKIKKCPYCGKRIAKTCSNRPRCRQKIDEYIVCYEKKHFCCMLCLSEYMLAKGYAKDIAIEDSEEGDYWRYI